MIDYERPALERVAQPAWLGALRQICEAEGSAADVPLPTPDEQHPTAVFLPILRPFLREGQRRLVCGIDALCQEHPQLPFDVPAVTASLLASLSRRLLGQTSRVFALELKVAGALWRLVGTTPEARFEYFVHHLSQPDSLLPLLEEHPVLARQLAPTIDQWVAASLEFLGHLCADWQQIRAVFSAEHDPGPLVEIQSSAGDRHRGGRTVMLLKFHSGFQLVYKPKSLAIDKHFQGLLCWLNAHGAEPLFKTLDVLDRGT